MNREDGLSKMRDFQREVLKAAHTKPIQADDFSWSPLRHYVFNVCKRAYFIRYYMAQGGWDVYTPTIAREAYFCKYVLTYDAWLSQTLRDSIRQALARMAAGDPRRKRRDFGFYLLRQFSHATFDLQQSLTNREYRFDANRPVFFEHLHGYEGFSCIDTLIQRVVDFFTNAYSVLSKSPLMQDVSALNFVDLRTDEKFCKAVLNGIPVWIVPGLVFFKEGCLCAINCEARFTDRISMDDFNRRISWTNSIFTMYGKQHYPSYPVTCTTFTFSPDLNGIVCNQLEENMESIISASCDEMRALVRPGELVFEEDFPKCGNPDTCKICRYASACRMMDASEHL